MLRTRWGVLALWAATAGVAFAFGRATAPPAAPPAPEDLATSIAAALGEGDPLERTGRTASLLERLEPEDLLEVVALYERILPVIGAKELGPLFAAWARFDPAGALDHALDWPVREKREERAIAARAAMQGWGQLDPSAAQLAFGEIATDHPALRRELWRGLVAGWAHSRRGQEGLGAFIAELRPTVRGEGVDLALRELMRRGGVEAMLDWADPILRDGSFNRDFQRSVFASTTGSAAHWDPQRSAAWVTEHAESGYAREGQRIVAEHWSGRDGAAAIAWLGGQPAGALRDAAVREAFGRWSRADPWGAKTWLDSDPPASLRNPALEAQAERLLPRKPEAALASCERIQDPGRQQSCTQSMAKSWYGRDPVAAEAWLQQSPLDEAARARVRRPAKKQEQAEKGPRRERARGVPR